MPAADVSVTPGPNGFSKLKVGGENGVHEVGNAKVEILDIRRAAVEINLKEAILSQFCPKAGPRTLPTLLLYDERGLQIFEEITYLDEYYLTNDEIALLKAHAAEIAQRISSGSMVIELGSGNLRKVNLLLQALEDAEKQVEYYALDLSRTELERTLSQLPAYRHVTCRGLWGTYDDGREWLREPGNVSRRKCILSLGSSIGNFSRDEAGDFLRHFAEVLSHGDHMLIGLDGCNKPAKVYHGYNDSKGLTHEFVLNGLTQANKILGYEAFEPKDWKVIGEYVFDLEGGRHQAFYSPIRETRVMGELIQPHERIQIEQSLKFSPEEAAKLWSSAGMSEAAQWKHDDEYGLHMLSRPKMPFSLIPASYVSTPLPTVADWEALWATWDLVTQKMIPQEELHEKPIKLRNACIFYLGHIPTFLDIQLTKTTKQPPSNPAYFYQIFERGIDPDVDNPELCHAHSEIPDEWPPLEDILTYQDTVRARLRGLYEGDIPRHVGRAIWVGFEHEVMHLETLLYMMLQSDRTLPPPGTHKPDWKKLSEKARAARVENEWFDVPAQEITVGIDEPDDATDPQLDYGWDNEKPQRKAEVQAFQAKGRPITNEEYARYMYDQQISTVPASWADNTDASSINNGTNGINGTNGHINGHSPTADLPESFLSNKSVRTVYGLVPLKYALDWPVFASYDELTGCARYLGGRIPTFEETRSIYHHAASSSDKTNRKLSRTVPAVNGHLSGNGVEETPPFKQVAVDGETPDRDLFIDLDGCNVGFQHWHPVPVTADGGKLAGQGGMGGVWEWTSSALEKWDGFEPMSLYPAYTADFFDGKHNIVLGGSWATHPRIAGRKSFVNWYQRNYPYAWCGARVVRDIE